MRGRRSELGWRLETGGWSLKSQVSSLNPQPSTLNSGDRKCPRVIRSIGSIRGSPVRSPAVPIWPGFGDVGDNTWGVLAQSIDGRNRQSWVIPEHGWSIPRTFGPINRVFSNTGQVSPMCNLLAANELQRRGVSAGTWPPDISPRFTSASDLVPARGQNAGQNLRPQEGRCARRRSPRQARSTPAGGRHLGSKEAVVEKESG
jgi:hypothetical protein